MWHMFFCILWKLWVFDPSNLLPFNLTQKFPFPLQSPAVVCVLKYPNEKPLVDHLKSLRGVCALIMWSFGLITLIQSSVGGHVTSSLQVTMCVMFGRRRGWKVFVYWWEPKRLFCAPIILKVESRGMRLFSIDGACASHRSMETPASGNF